MKIYSEQSLADFKFWSGAETTAQRIWEEQGSEGFDQLEAILEDLYPDGIDETDLNDLLWFDADTVYEWLGIEDEEEIAAASPESRFTPGDVQMIEDYHNLREEQQKRLMAYLEALKKIESLEDM